MRTRSGFTLVEMIITIGIIVLLAGLTLSVSVAVVRGSEARETETTLRILETAIREWEVQSDRRVSYGKVDEPQGAQYEVDVDAGEYLSQLIAIIRRTPTVKEMLARIDPEFAVQDPNDPQRLQIFDAWDRQLAAVFPGRLRLNNSAYLIANQVFTRFVA